MCGPGTSQTGHKPQKHPSAKQISACRGLTTRRPNPAQAKGQQAEDVKTRHKCLRMATRLRADRSRKACFRLKAELFAVLCAAIPCQSRLPLVKKVARQAVCTELW